LEEDRHELFQVNYSGSRMERLKETTTDFKLG